MAWMGSKNDSYGRKKRAHVCSRAKHTRSHLRMHIPDTRYKIHANYTHTLETANKIQTSLKYGWNDDDYDNNSDNSDALQSSHFDVFCFVFDVTAIY